MKSSLAIFGLFLCVVVGVAAHEQAHHDAVPLTFSEALMYAPSPVPDRVILSWSDDPASTQSVTWRTDTSVDAAIAEIAVATADGRRMQTRQFEATTSFFESDLNQAHYHSLTFRDLEPDTLYAYRVGDGTYWSEFYHFKTAAKRPAPFSFIYFGDAQNEVRTHWSRVFREAFRDAPRAAFALHAGDLINDGGRDIEWGEWHGAPAWVNGTIPVIATPGNHEYYTAYPGKAENGSAQELSEHWREQFTFPVQSVPSGLEETVYYIDYQGTRIISLDSNRDHEAQARWLRPVLRDNPNRWTIVTFHHPMFSPAPERDNASLRRWWKPLIDEFAVDLVLSGHDHSYARTGDVSGSSVSENIPDGYQQAYDPDIGTIYVVSVSGPKLYQLTSETFARRVAENTQLYQVITVEDGQLVYKAYTAVGSLYDTFTLEKREGAANRLHEALPPQRLSSPQR